MLFYYSKQQISSYFSKDGGYFNLFPNNSCFFFQRKRSISVFIKTKVVFIYRKNSCVLPLLRELLIFISLRKTTVLHFSLLNNGCYLFFHRQWRFCISPLRAWINKSVTSNPHCQILSNLHLLVSIY